MSFLNNPFWLLITTVCFVVIYSWGQYGKNVYREYLRVIGLAGVGFLLLQVFTSSCPVSATRFALIVLGAAIACRLIFGIGQLLGKPRRSSARFDFSARVRSGPRDIGSSKSDTSAISADVSSASNRPPKTAASPTSFEI